MSITKTLLGLALATVVLPAAAQEAQEGTAFVRVEGGRTDLKVEGQKGDDTGYGVRGGYYFSPHFGVEGFYARYGEDSNDFGRAKAYGYGVGVFGKSNFGEAPYSGFFVSARAGVSRNQLDVSLAGVGSDDHDTNYYVGVGTGYDFNENFGLSLNYDYLEPKAFDTRFKIETLTLGLEYRF